MKNITVLLISVIACVNVFSQNLQIEWQQCFGGSEDDAASDIALSNSAYFIAGSTLSNDGDISFLHGGQDWWLIKSDVKGNIIWEQTYGGSNGEHLLRIIPSNEGNFFLLGSSYSSDGDISNDPYPESTDYWIVRIDSSGNILWDKILGGNMLDQMWTGTLTDDGGIVAFGWTGSPDGDVTEYFGAYDMWMVKLNNEGEKEWDFTIGTDDFDYGHAIIQTSNGGFLVGGASAIGEGGNLTCEPFNYNAEAILVKLDSNRNIEWQQCYGGSGHDVIWQLIELLDGYLFVGGASSNDGDITGWHGEGDIWAVKIDFFGNIVWQRCLGGSKSEYAYNVYIVGDSNFIIVGSTRSNDGDVSGNHSLSEYDYDIWIVKLSSEGELLFQQCIGGEGNERVDFGVLKKSDNNFAIAGQTDYGPSYNVQCTPHSFIVPDFWVFEITDTSTNVIVQNENKNMLKVYPNPAQDYIVFEMPFSTKQNIMHNNRVRNSTFITINNVFGNQETKLHVNSQKTVWNTKDVQPGVYFYKAYINGIPISGKLIIQH